MLQEETTGNERLPWEDEPSYSLRPNYPPDATSSTPDPVPSTTIDDSHQKPARPHGGYPASFRLEVTLEALKGNRTQREISEQYGITQALVSIWKSKAIEILEDAIENKCGKTRRLSRKIDSLDQVFASADIASFQNLIRMLRDAATSLERFPKLLESLLKQESKD